MHMREETSKYKGKHMYILYNNRKCVVKKSSAPVKETCKFFLPNVSCGGYVQDVEVSLFSFQLQKSQVVYSSAYPCSDI